MANIEAWLSGLGSIASIGAAIWAYIEAKAAADSATKAEQVKNEIVDRRKLVEISQIHAETSRILKIISKVGPSCNREQIRGVNCLEIAKDVEEYCRYLNEQSSHFKLSFDNEAQNLYESLKENIESLSEAKSFEDIKNAGKTIYYKINSFMPTVKKLSDNKKENVPNT